jgi:hypothetical protein
LPVAKHFRVADPELVTFFCLPKKKVTKENGTLVRHHCCGDPVLLATSGGCETRSLYE